MSIKVVLRSPSCHPFETRWEVDSVPWTCQGEHKLIEVWLLARFRGRNPHRSPRLRINLNKTVLCLTHPVRPHQVVVYGRGLGGDQVLVLFGHNEYRNSKRDV